MERTIHCRITEETLLAALTSDYTDTLKEYIQFRTTDSNGNTHHPHAPSFLKVLHLILNNAIPHSVGDIIRNCRFFGPPERPIRLIQTTANRHRISLPPHSKHCYRTRIHSSVFAKILTLYGPIRHRCTRRRRFLITHRPKLNREATTTTITT